MLWAEEEGALPPLREIRLRAMSRGPMRYIRGMPTWRKGVLLLFYADRNRADGVSMGRNEKIVDAIECIQEIREIIDDRDAVLRNVTYAVEILNGILREDTVFSISVKDPPDAIPDALLELSKSLKEWHESKGQRFELVWVWVRGAES